MSLTQYQRKRNFKKTPEPQGKVAKPSEKGLRFVVHYHAATRPHFDLRLEIDGVYKSWAVPKGPTLNPSEQRLAVFVEDHPIDYGDFEGIIPKGNYGAGTVMIWDRGTYVERTGKNDQLAQYLDAGKITLLLDGEKLKGEFALIRIRKDDKTWLLVKKHDKYANRNRNFAFDDRSVVSGRTMQEIKDAADAKWVRHVGRIDTKTGMPTKAERPPEKKAAQVTEEPAAKKAVAPRTSTKSFPRAKRAEISAGPWIFEEAWEGYRATAEVKGKAIKLVSQHGIPFSEKFQTIVKALKQLKHDCVLEGTIAAIDDAGHSTRATLSQYMSQGEGTLVFMINDILSSAGEDWRPKPLQERKEELTRVLSKAPKPLTLTPYQRGDEQTHLQTLGFSQPFILARPAFSTHREGTSKSHLLPLDAPLAVATEKPTAAWVGTAPPPKLTNLKKVYWPKDGYTKGDLIAYYESIANIILPHLRDHPLSLNRYPNGIDMPGFYQKDLTGHVPRWLQRHRVYSPSADRSIDYALCQNKESLLYLANLGCIEFHPWISRIQTLEYPDYCIIDLDPDNHDYADIIKTALVVKKYCDAANIPLHPKTSGASGMHLCIPLGAKYSFDASRDLALAIAEKVHAELPQLTSLKRNPGLRRGKIYLDCFQNRRGQTLAAPYCVRPFPGAPVSTPLQWKELKAGLTPRQFTMKNIMQRLHKLGDFWLRPDAPGIDLNAAMDALNGNALTREKPSPTSRNKRSS